MQSTRIIGRSRPKAAEWLAGEHSRLDARLAGVLLQSVWGAPRELRRELTAYRSELRAHLRAVEQRFFSLLTALDARTRGAARLEWQAQKDEVERVFADIDRDLQGWDRSDFYGHFDHMRRVLRRYRRYEESLLALIRLSAPSAAPEMAEVLL